MVKNTGSRMTLLACCKQTNNRGNNKGASVIQLIPTIGTVKSVRPPYRIKVKLLTIGGLLAYQPTAVAQDSYKIGTLLPLTGNYGTIGSAMQKSDTLAMKHINEAGGIMGHELDLVNRDTTSTPTGGVDAARKLVQVDGVPAIVGAENLEGIKGTSQGVLEGPSVETFRDSYYDEFDEFPPKPFMEPGYDAVVSIAFAIASSGKAPDEVTPTDIRDNLRTVTSPPGEKVYAGPEELEKAFDLLAEGEEINYIGAAGEVAYDDYGDAASAIQIWQVEDGEFVTFDNVIPEPVARENLGERYME